jgi:aryl-alcohol dehydrogenase-like predicted oxidoreductase
MDVAGEAQTLAAALNHSAFNMANALGAWLGGVAISAGLGWTSTGWVGALLALAGIGIFGTGLTVSRLALGTMTFGLQTDETVSHQILDKAAEGGINFLDTADVYPLGGTVETTGRTEEIIGNWLEKQGPAGRRRFVVATKAVNKVGPNPWDQGASRKHLLDAIDLSLKRLKTDHVDLYQLHMDDRETPLEETLEALDVIVNSGRARYIGVSNFLAYRLARALGKSDLHRFARFVSVQPRYSLSVPRDRARAVAARERRGAGRDSLQPAGRRPAHRQVQARRQARGEHPLHARHGRRHVPGPLLERAQLQHRDAAAQAGRRSGRAARDAGGGVGDGEPADHRAAARCEPSGAVRRDDRGGGIQARSGAQAEAR